MLDCKYVYIRVVLRRSTPEVGPLADGADVLKFTVAANSIGTQIDAEIRTDLEQR